MEVVPDDTLHDAVSGRPDRKCHRKYLGYLQAGECGAGLHGANRFGGNSLSDLLVSEAGRRLRSQSPRIIRWEGESG